MSTVPLKTLQSAGSNFLIFFSRGMHSPVSALSSTKPFPRVTSPSTGICSPGRTQIIIPAVSLVTATDVPFETDSPLMVASFANTASLPADASALKTRSRLFSTELLARFSTQAATLKSETTRAASWSSFPKIEPITATLIRTSMFTMQPRRSERTAPSARGKPPTATVVQLNNASAVPSVIEANVHVATKNTDKITSGSLRQLRRLSSFSPESAALPV
mmetsp:Transcript_57293/g.78115  ORF Transcript_57293/g.78115 Transcript_57293/m.78115 type:complete len:219 (-) Transcript_57293:276-932(-)